MNAQIPNTRATPQAAVPALDIRTGIDLVDVPELREMMARHPAFRLRVFTQGERAACDAHPDPAPHYAARFAAKEAACKALGIGLMATGIDRTLSEIEVVRSGRRPTLAWRGRPARTAAKLGVFRQTVSLTHTSSGAVASVVLLTQSDTAGDNA